MNTAFWKKYDKAFSKFGSQRRVANYLKIPRTTLQGWLKDRKRSEIDTPVLPTFNVMRKDAPIKITTNGKTPTRFIFLAAQDQSEVHAQFLLNLETYANYMNAEIVVGGFTYNKSLFEDHAKNNSWYHPSIQKYLTHRQFVFGEELVFCGEMNTLPTAVTPLSGFETYTRHRSGIFPHAKVQLQSIPTMKNAYTKVNMTTGAITLPNYVPKRAGIQAAFHHVVGAVIVEVDPEKENIWFARHIQAETNGSFQDLDVYVTDGKIIVSFDVEAINWGDLHFPRYDSQVINSAFKHKGMLDILNPSYQFIHDATDFDLRSHHNMKDPHKVFATWFWSEGMRIEESFENLGIFLKEEVTRDFCKTVIVESNHDKHFAKWLRDSDWKNDPANAEIYLEGNLHVLREIKRSNTSPNMLEWAIRRQMNKNNEILDRNIVFLNEDDSFVICQREDDTGIECGMHGHLGANGAKAHPKQFTKMGPKANTGHTHSASIIDGIYTAGTSSLLDLGYNNGLSSWTHSHIVTYKNGKRAIVTMRDGKWRV